MFTIALKEFILKPYLGIKREKIFVWGGHCRGFQRAQPFGRVPRGGAPWPPEAVAPRLRLPTREARKRCGVPEF